MSVSFFTYLGLVLEMATSATKHSRHAGFVNDISEELLSQARLPPLSLSVLTDAASSHAQKLEPSAMSVQETNAIDPCNSQKRGSTNRKNPWTY